MLRVANVPSEKFEQMVEDSKTLQQIVDAGTKKSERVKPQPYRAEWLDWTQAITHLATIPACGLNVLAERRPDEISDLKSDCDKAMRNLKSWKSELENV